LCGCEGDLDPALTPQGGTITERMRANDPAYLGGRRDVGGGVSDIGDAGAGCSDSDDNLTRSQLSLE